MKTFGLLKIYVKLLDRSFSDVLVVCQSFCFSTLISKSKTIKTVFDNNYKKYRCFVHSFSLKWIYLALWLQESSQKWIRAFPMAMNWNMVTSRLYTGEIGPYSKFYPYNFVRTQLYFISLCLYYRRYGKRIKYIGKWL